MKKSKTPNAFFRTRPVSVRTSDLSPNALGICLDNSREVGPMAGETVKVAVIENEIEAGLLGSVLAERSIPHTLRSYRDSAYDGLYQVQKGWGAVYAPAGFKAEILEILADIRRGPAGSGLQDAESNSASHSNVSSAADPKAPGRSGEAIERSEG